MTKLEIQLKRIQEKLQLLIRHHAALEKENLHLKEELEQQRLRSESDLKNMEELKQQVEVLKITSGDWDEQDKKEFEKRVNNYIREIDRCIALLSE